MMLERDFLFADEGCICDLRAVGVLVKNGHIFVQRERDGNEYALPGGHVKIGETLESGLVREFREEVGVDIRVQRLLWSEECFWTWKGRQAHSIAFYYRIEADDLPDGGEFVPHRDNGRVVVGWLDIGALGDVTVYPRFLPDEIHRLDGPIKHFVSN